MSAHAPEPHEVLLRLGYGDATYRDRIERRKRLLSAARAAAATEYPDAGNNLIQRLASAAADMMADDEIRAEHRAALRPQLRRAA